MINDDNYPVSSFATLILSDYIFDFHFTVRIFLLVSAHSLSSKNDTVDSNNNLFNRTKMQEKGSVGRPYDDVPALIFLIFDIIFRRFGRKAPFSLPSPAPVVSPFSLQNC